MRKDGRGQSCGAHFLRLFVVRVSGKEIIQQEIEKGENKGRWTGEMR
jgi:hypothetical protein